MDSTSMTSRRLLFTTGPPSSSQRHHTAPWCIRPHKQGFTLRAVPAKDTELPGIQPANTSLHSHSQQHQHQKPQQHQQQPRWRQQRPDEDGSGPRPALATSLIRTGLIGTVALGIAHATGIQLDAMLHWSPHALSEALVWVAPLIALHLVIMLPDYAWSWTEPTPTRSSTAASRASSRMFAGPSNSSSSGVICSSSAVEGACLPGPSSSSARASGEGSASLLWHLPRRWRGQLRAVQDAFHLAQGHHVAVSATAHMRLEIDMAFTALQSVANELLQRGMAVAWTAAWLDDRAYEAGFEELLLLAPVPLGPQGLATTAAACLSTAVTLGLAVRRVTTPCTRVVIVPDPIRSDVADTVSSRHSRIAPMLPPTPAIAMTTLQQTAPLTSFVQSTLSVSEAITMNGLFVATGGDLAACVCGGVTTQLVLAAATRRRLQRTSERCVGLAQHLTERNLLSRDISAR